MRLSFYYLRSLNAPFAAAGSMIVRRLHDLCEFGPQALERHLEKGEEIRVTPQRKKPSPWLVGPFLAGRACNSFWVTFLKRKQEKQWFIACRKEREYFTARNVRFTPKGFRDFTGRPGLG